MILTEAREGPRTPILLSRYGHYIPYVLLAEAPFMQPDPISCLSFLCLFCLRRTVDSPQRGGEPEVGNGIEVEMEMEMEL